MRLADQQQKGIYSSISNLAKHALELLARRKEIGQVERQYPTSQLEFEAIEGGGQLGCVVYLPDKSFRAIDVDSLTTVGELVSQLGELKKLTGWVIFQTISAKDYLLGEKECVCDVLAKWERLELPKHIEESVEFQFAFSKHLYTRTDNELSTSVGTAMLFAHIEALIARGKLRPSDEDVVALTALRLRLTHGEYLPAKFEELRREFSTSTLLYVPKHILKEHKLVKISMQEFVAKVLSQYCALPQMTPVEAMKRYLNIVKGVQLYGYSVFAVHYVFGKEKEKKRALLCLNEDGYQLWPASPGGKPFRVVRLADIASYGHTKTSVSINSGNLSSPQVDTFVSDEASQIAAAFSGYMKLLGRQRKTALPGIF